MKSVKVGRSVSESGLDGCVSMCGMCPSCVFAPDPPASSRSLWRASDEFRRSFVVGLLLRCTNTHVLQSIQGALGVTSWSLFTYARSRRPVSPEDYPFPSREDRPPDGRPAGMDLNGIWDWFSSSPDWRQTRYLCRLFSLCDAELLRMLANLTSVLLVRQRRGFLHFNASRASQCGEDSDEDSEDPALMVVPGSSRSMSGVSHYKDFIGCLPVDLSKRILGLLDENTLRRCQKVCRRWQHLAQETVEEVKFRRRFQDQITAMMKRCQSINRVSPTYANIIEVPIPVKDEDRVDIHPSVQKIQTFEAAYAKIQTKTVQMEERNVYCGAYFTKVLLSKEDPHRVVDYRGGPFMATGSKDRTVRLLYVGSETKAVSVMKGHVGSIRAVLLCEDRHLLITGSCDAIRCWCLRTDSCVMMLHGHGGTVTCLDVHDDRLVSGAKDCIVKVWSLNTGKLFEDFPFKHPSPVQCVRINSTTVFSSCDRGLVKVWDTENAALLRVIDVHRSSVKCLFVDEWYFLSGDCNGQLKAWSINCDVKECLMTFNHPKEVKSVTLVYLRVVTGCVDGKIRIFNFLTGDCLREIRAEAETGRILSLHFHDDRILVNATSSVKLYQFAKVFWDYAESAEGDQGDVEAQDVSEKSAVSLKKLPLTSVEADHSQKMNNYNKKKPKRAELTCFLPTHTKCRAQDRCETAEATVTLSEKATSERMKRRGLHHPLTRDSILLKVNAIQRTQRMDEVSINTESNAQLRDSWGPRTSQDDLKRSPHPHGGPLRRAETCVPILKRDVSTARDATRRQRPCLLSKEGQPRSAAKRVSGFTTTSTSLPRISPVAPLRDPGLTATHLEDCRAKKDLMDPELSKRNQKKEKTL